ncbi:MAG: hypothetical protein HY586_05145 [Candidatus Omnitrophica bacterium]|nr:hypothetical protein [Candidatus Omnitrophota bacterium]
MNFFRSVLMIFFFFLWLGGYCAFPADFLMASEGEFVYDSRDRRDPFIPLVGPGSLHVSDAPSFRLEDIKLEGIVEDPKGGSFIMVDGEVYNEGEKIGPYSIEKIKEKQVTFEYNGKRSYVQMTEE